MATRLRYDMGYAAEPHPTDSGGCDWMVLFAISAKKRMGRVCFEQCAGIVSGFGLRRGFCMGEMCGKGQGSLGIFYMLFS